MLEDVGSGLLCLATMLQAVGLEEATFSGCFRRWGSFHDLDAAPVNGRNASVRAGILS